MEEYTPIKSLTISNFMGFGNQKQTVKFGIPEKDKLGSGLTIIAGANNSGKTSIIEALLKCCNYKSTSFNNSELRSTSNEPTLELVTKNKETFIFSNTKNNLSKIIVSDGKNEANNSYSPFKAASLTSRRYWATSTLKDIPRIKAGTHPASTSYASYNGNIRNPNVDILAEFIGKIIDNEGHSKKFYDIIKTMVKDFKDLRIEREDGRTFLTYTLGDRQHKASSMGDGIISLLSICIYLLEDEIEVELPIGDGAISTPHVTGYNILIIDEPENSLHPAVQKALISNLAKIAKKKQVILVTHSPHFIRWQDLSNGASFVRTSLDKDHNTIVSHLHKDPEENKKVNHYSKLLKDNCKQPYFLDVVAKEIFFYDKVLLVEGQEDVGLIKRWLTEEYKDSIIPFEIFGYGAGGVDNIPKFADMALDLGVKKIGILTDRIALTSHDLGIQAWIEKLDEPDIKKALGGDLILYRNAEILIQFLETEDIRDKWKVDTQKKIGDFMKNKENMEIGEIHKNIDEIITRREGVFNNKLELKSKYTYHFKKVFDNFKEFFNSEPVE